MSLLTRGRHRVTVYPAVDAVDGDGNPCQAASPTGCAAYATIQPLSSEETEALGLQTTESYRLHFTDSRVIGPGSQICWLGKRWSVDGFPKRHTGSRRTEHLEYRIRRA